jgi:uncharacterized protein (UPF0335 family)
VIIGLYDGGTAVQKCRNDLPNDFEGDKPALRFWEIDFRFKCPAVGLCLTYQEQRKIVKKAGLARVIEDPFELHELLVACGEDENALSRRVDLLLWEKFGATAIALHRLDEPALMEHWEAGFASGDYTALFWAAVTRPDLSGKAKADIFAEIHMSMHSTSMVHAADRRELERLRAEVERLSQKMKRLNADRQALQKENDTIRLSVRALKAELLVSKKERELPGSQAEILKNNGLLAKTEAENLLLRGEVAEKERCIDIQGQLVHDLKKQTATLAARIESERQAHTKFREEAQGVIREFITSSRCNRMCPSFDLCSKRVLIVGGISRMEALYRRLIEENGGTLDYHDGYMNGGSRNLEVSLKRADVILCPVNCNSHAACSMVKSLGKKHRKPVHMLANISLSTVSQVLSGNGRNVLTAHPATAWGGSETTPELQS